MRTRTHSPPEVLRWDAALRWILVLLESGPEAAGRPWEPRPGEIELLRMAGFGPLLAEGLAGHPAFPALFAEEVLNRRRVQAHREVLARLLERLDGRIAPPVVFKGMAACDLLYEQPSLRVFSDIDALIPARDLALWAEAIRSLGGCCKDDELFRGRRISGRRYFQHTYRVPGGESGTDVDLDLHLSFGPRQCYAMDYDRTTSEAMPSECGPYLVLRPPAWICALAIHQARALFVWNYQDYVDLFQILRRNEVDEGGLREVARRFGVGKAASVLLRHLRLLRPPGSAVRVPSLEDLLPAGCEAFEAQLRLPVASRALADPSLLHNARLTSSLADSRTGLLRYILAYAMKRALDLVIRT